MSLGTMALESGGRVDFARLRRERFQRVLDVMEEHDLGALLIGREPNAQYICGVRRLHLAGTRPWGPGCVVVRETRQVHLMSVWDDGMPPEVAHEQLFGLSWNPMNLVSAVQKIEGIATARRIGVDYMSPLFKQLLPMAAPDAQLVNAEAFLRSVRARKTTDEVMCIKTAAAIAESSLTSVVHELRPGVTGRALLGAFEARMTDFGITAPATEGTFRAIAPSDQGGRPRLARLTTNETIDEGALVALCGGVLYAGYVGSVGRTWPCTTRRARSVPGEQRELYRRWRDVWSRVRDACKPGATGADLVAGYTVGGEPLPDFPVAYSVGVGHEGPIAGSALGEGFDARQTLAPGMVLAVQPYVTSDHGGYYAQEVVHITNDGNEVLTAMSHGPFEDGS